MKIARFRFLYLIGGSTIMVIMGIALYQYFVNKSEFALAVGNAMTFVMPAFLILMLFVGWKYNNKKKKHLTEQMDREMRDNHSRGTNF